ncbi:MAG: Na+/H+ antiporter [Bacteroidetes bacterium]|nr:Na+/H+ antiporter [Bacteroidota bacterium]
MGMPWPLAFVLGAVLSATDAVAATSITKGLGLTHKTLTILEGESLINDASGLIAYRFAVAAVAGSSFIWYKAGGQFILLLAGGVLLGAVAGKLLQFILHHTRQNGIVAISFTLLFPFVTYSLAEDLHVSGVIAVVVLGVFTTRLTSMYFPAATKAQSKAFWDIIVFILNGLVFILIGLEFPYVIHNVKSIQILPLIGYSFLIVFVTIAIRVVRIFLESHRHYLTFRKTGTDRHKKALLDWKTCLIVGWSGMRGIVSLATALALPEKLDSGAPFPQRDTIIFIAVMVVVISLVMQGLTLPLLVKWLKLKPDGRRHRLQEA